jgi:hypothetical protein
MNFLMEVIIMENKSLEEFLGSILTTNKRLKNFVD